MSRRIGVFADRWMACAALLVALCGCSSVPSTSIYRGLIPAQVTAAIALSVPQAEAMVQQFAAATLFDASAKVDRPFPAGSQWQDWAMPYDQHLRIQRSEDGQWRLLTRRPDNTWTPWHYQPERTATFVAVGTWRQHSEPIAVVAYGSDVVFLVRKVWHVRRSGRPGSIGTGLAFTRRQKDWIDLDLSAVLKPNSSWRLFLDGEERALWIFPWSDGHVDSNREGWRIAITAASEVSYRLATRVKFVQGQVGPQGPVAP